MGETAAEVGNLEVSVSFGRFENDLLSWERWSSFSQNKYLEEVEKCSTPGSVAEKKAYFESHYKKIAAKKVEIEDQQKQFEATMLMPPKNDGRRTSIKNEDTDDEQKQLVDEKPIGESQSAEISEKINKPKQLELDQISGSNRFAYPIQSTQSCVTDFQSSDNDTDGIQLVKKVNNLNNEPGGANFVEKPNYGDTGEVFQTNFGEKQESNFRSEIRAGFVRELEHEPLVKDSPWLFEARTEKNFLTGKVLKSSTEEMTNLETQKMAEVILSNTERRVTKIKKAPLSLTPKSSQISSSTPKTMMPASTSSMIFSSPSSAVMGSVSSKSSFKNSPTKHKKLAPRTDTVSPSPGLGRYAPDTATRKSILTDKMREKDIVKQAFNSFRTARDPTTSLGDQSDSLPKQVLRKEKDTKVKETLTSQKGKEWLHRTGAISADVAQTAPLFATSRAETITHKGKEMKKVSRNLNVKAVAGSHIPTKLKEVKETSVKDLQQNRRFKATPLPAFYRGTGVSKSITRKESPKPQSTDKHPDKRA